MSDVETSFYNEDILKEKSPVDNKIPRSPAVATYESYAAWRKKKFPPKALDYNAEDYSPPSAKNTNDNYSTQRQSDFNSKKSSYFPTDDESLSNHNQPDSRLPPRSSQFSPDLENLHLVQKPQERRSFPSQENPNMFQGNGSRVQLNTNAARRSIPENRISREAENCLKLYSSSPSDSGTLQTRHRNVATPRRPSQFPAASKSGQREIKNGIPVEYSRASPNALQPVRQEYRTFPNYPTCPGDHKNQSESGEMVKGLLKLIDNQNEQIKNLQSQLDRLLSIHEETLKERTKCMCSMELSRQNPQICMQAYNAALQRKSAITTDNYSHHELSKFPEYNQVTSNDASKKALMERKVSIGVMTSFEFTVQNSPFNNDAESQPIVEEEEEEEETHREITTQDLSKRKLFSRMPSALENITEDSESHLSLQPSSNLSSCKGGNTQTRKSTSPNSNSGNMFPIHNSPSNFKRSTTTQFDSNFQKQNRTKTSGEEIKSVSPTPSGHADENYREKQKAALSNQQRRFDPREKIEDKKNFQEESLILGEEQVQVGERSAPSPSPSIHIENEDFSSEEGSVLTKRTPRVGWTFYNNVLGQVNHILQNSPLQDQDPRNKNAPQELDKNLLIDTVKAATIDQLTKLGISFADNEREAANANANKKVSFDTSYYSRLNPEVNMMQGSSIMTETSTSMHMKALAMKYLKEEQISDAVQQKQKRDALSNLMVSNVQGTTNMSFATMRYLQRYQLLPESMNGLVEDEGKENFQAHDIGKNREAISQKPRINLPSRPAIAPATRSHCPSKILDISTLKQQPKLL